MPYISVNTTTSLTKVQKDEIKTELGSAITLIPGKSEQVLMVDISDGHTMYFSGKEMEKCAFIDVRCYKSANFDDNKKFTQAVYQLMKRITGISENEIYLSISELPSWGLNGTLI